MTNNPWGVVLVHQVDHPLLMVGACRGATPWAEQYLCTEHGEVWLPGRPARHCTVCGQLLQREPQRMGLVLKWERQRVRLGMLWAAWLLEQCGWEPLVDEDEPHGFEGWRAFDLTPEALAAYCEGSDIGTALAVDDKGSAIRLGRLAAAPPPLREDG